jgi:hypothetical protein
MWLKSDLVLCSDYNPNKSESGINFWNALVKKAEAIIQGEAQPPAKKL